MWSRSEYNAMQHHVEGVYNVVFVVTLIVYIGENCTLHSLIYMWLRCCVIIFDCWSPFARLLCLVPGVILRVQRAPQQ